MPTEEHVSPAKQRQSKCHMPVAGWIWNGVSQAAYHGGCKHALLPRMRSQPGTNWLWKWWKKWIYRNKPLAWRRWAVLFYRLYGYWYAGSSAWPCLCRGTGIKRLMPEKYVFTYRAMEILLPLALQKPCNAINRGENILIVFAMNNAVYGMTSGQMAPPLYRAYIPPPVRMEGCGLLWCAHQKVSELMANLPGAYYVTRQAVKQRQCGTPYKKALQRLLNNQQLHMGNLFGEIIGTVLPTGKWHPLKHPVYWWRKWLKHFH